MTTLAARLELVRVSDMLYAAGIPLGEGSSGPSLKERVFAVVAGRRNIPTGLMTQAISDKAAADDADNNDSSKSGVLGMAQSVGSFVVKSFAGRLAFAIARFALGVARTVVWNVGRFVLTRLAIPLLSGLATVLTSPIGIGVAAVLAAGGLGYWLYRTFFKGDNPESVPREEEKANYYVGPRARQKDESVDYGGSSAGSSGGYSGGYSAAPTTGSPGATAGSGSSAVQPYTVTGTAARMEYKADESSASEVARGQQILKSKRSASVAAAIDEASRRTGIDSAILNAIAYKESTFNASAAAPTSSAKGLFQFIKGTWKSVVDRYGAKYGLPPNADPFDPLASAIVGAIYLKHEIYPQISKARPTPNATDMYLGHFMGPAGGKRWLLKLAQNPNAYAYLDWQREANANKWVYFHKNGNPKTYAEIYETFSKGLRMIEAAVNAQKEETASVSPTEPVGKTDNVVMDKPPAGANAVNTPPDGGAVQPPQKSTNTQPMKYKKFLITAPAG